ncbi:MAG: hypothetical protein ACRCZ6_17750 [Kluyvera sp.]|uniref:hypothetical protein n=1 Tax=Kluyvera sp. TaxID=1538228 RepID=UPI003F3C3BB2
MSRLLRGYVCLLIMGMAGAGIMFANHQMRTWPEKSSNVAAITPDLMTFPQTRVALDAGIKMGLALEWRPQAPGQLALTQAESIENVNRWLEKMAAENRVPRRLSLKAAQPEGYVIIENIGFD